MSIKAYTNKGDLYEVERIVGYRYNVILNRDEYLVKWVGYPNDQCTWQTIEDLNYCRQLVKEFLRNEIRPRTGDPNLPMPNFDSESELVDLPFPEEDTKEAQMKRVFPDNEECGIAKGWKPNHIIGAQLEKKPYTYYVEYEGKLHKEHINGKFMYKNCPKMVEMFHKEIGVPNPYKKDRRRQEKEKSSSHRRSSSHKDRRSTSKYGHYSI